ncbi:MAG: hypothetical protein WCT49_01525 [Candidatus Paceibacterota bacterium]|jgi:hypothetical protein|nr:hypothetical protein [Candidatus Paceibacterota bacterium]
MGGGTYRPTDYATAVKKLHDTGATFARSTTASRTGNYHNIAEILDPRKLKNGMRESCFHPGFNGVLPIIVSIDGTGSMSIVPHHVQADLPNLITMLNDQGVSDNVNVMFMMHDDEHAMPPDAVFQMSQFETTAPTLVEALNEMIIPGYGGGNDGEAYHIAFYAAARHTRLESFERDGTKGFFFMICDEQPYYDASDPSLHGTLPSVAKEVFGDTNQKEITMLESVKEVAKRYHIFIIRPGNTNHGADRTITRMWQKLLSDAGENPQNVLEVARNEEIVSTMAMSVARLYGLEEDDIVDVLRSKGAAGVLGATAATKNLVAVSGTGALMPSTSTKAIKTMDDKSSKGRKR